jgi:hypothetical protein
MDAAIFSDRTSAAPLCSEPREGGAGGYTSVSHYSSASVLLPAFVGPCFDRNIEQEDSMCTVLARGGREGPNSVQLAKQREGLLRVHYRFS